EDERGGILLICAEKGGESKLYELSLDFDGDMFWRLILDKNGRNLGNLETYLQQRIKQDSDIWLIELSIADAQRFAEEVLASA
ncbi:MAG: DUF1491 family protein, partial [Alphaproteobacteria bacterium]|nr:DUF1491 family protein [Alphaproteobacteria bacterium]